jgi:hypothetical protein
VNAKNTPIGDGVWMTCGLHPPKSSLAVPKGVSLLVVFCLFRKPSKEVRSAIAIWLILPVVIRLSQRLSHACLSINESIL